MDQHSIDINGDPYDESDHNTLLSKSRSQDSSTNTSTSGTATSLPTLIQNPSTITTKTNKENLLMNKFAYFVIDMIYTLSCIAVAVDPFFLYIPIIHQKKKCLGVDTKVRDAALILRSLTDIPFLIIMIGRIRAWIEPEMKILPNYMFHTKPGLLWSNPKKYFSQSYAQSVNFGKIVAKGMPYTYFSFVIDLLSILPIPQVALVVVFFRLKSPGFMYNRAAVNVLVLFQYLPRIERILLYKNKIILERNLTKGAFNFYLYIIGSHVLGAIWYYFSIQRETSCWYKACKNTAGCSFNFYCGDITTATSITLLNESCPTSPPNATVVDFGIYLDALQSGITGPMDSSSKFFYILWWGFRNLSNFGTNLETSTYLWENMFAILISAMGLLLFSYLVGNVQMFMLKATAKSIEEDEEKAVKLEQEIQRYDEEKKRYLKQKYPEVKKAEQDQERAIQWWMPRLTKNKKWWIPRYMRKKKQRLDENIDINNDVNV